MIKGVIYGRELALAGSPLTLLYFREQFDQGLPAFLQQAYQVPLDPEEFLRVAWAMAKTYNPDTQEYEEWLNEFPDEAFSLGEGTEDAISVIDSAISAELFCRKQTLWQRAWKLVKRLFGRIGRRLKRQ